MMCCKKKATKHLDAWKKQCSIVSGVLLSPWCFVVWLPSTTFIVSLTHSSLLWHTGALPGHRGGNKEDLARQEMCGLYSCTTDKSQIYGVVPVRLRWGEGSVWGHTNRWDQNIFVCHCPDLLLCTQKKILWKFDNQMPDWANAREAFVVTGN